MPELSKKAAEAQAKHSQEGPATTLRPELANHGGLTPARQNGGLRRASEKNTAGGLRTASEWAPSGLRTASERSEGSLRPKNRTLKARIPDSCAGNAREAGARKKPRKPFAFVGFLGVVCFQTKKKWGYSGGLGDLRWVLGEAEREGSFGWIVEELMEGVVVVREEMVFVGLRNLGSLEEHWGGEGSGRERGSEEDSRGGKDLWWRWGRRRGRSEE